MRVYNDPASSAEINVVNFGVLALGKKEGFA